MQMHNLQCKKCKCIIRPIKNVNKKGKNNDSPYKTYAILTHLNNHTMQMHANASHKKKKRKEKEKSPTPPYKEKRK